MLQSLGIYGYRKFEHLEIPKLGRMNLITGKNNVGKTSLLEAIRLYNMNGSGYVLLDILESRDEHLLMSDVPVDVDHSRDEMLDFSYLFSTKFSSEGTYKFSIGPLHENNKNLQVSLRPDEMPSIRMETALEGDLTSDDSMARQAIIVEINEDLRQKLYVDNSARDLRFQLRRQTESSDTAPCIFVPALVMEPRVLNAFWDRIALTSAEQDVIEALRVIEPRIDRISFVGLRHNRITRIPMVKLRNVDTPIPLRNLGDGMNHVFTCVLALVSAKGGTLLIDEIENGLHYSIQLQLWRLILNTAEQLNVQVFATSHSWDCVEAFQQATLEKNSTDGVLIRLDRQEDKIFATIFDEDELRIATRARIEVR